MIITPKIILIGGAVLQAFGIIALVVANGKATGYPTAESDPAAWIPLTWYLRILAAMFATACLTGFLAIGVAILRRQKPDVQALPPTNEQAHR